MDDSALRRMEREARERSTGMRRPGAEARAATCELCGAGSVRWGSMCEACRERLRGVDAEPCAAEPPPAPSPARTPTRRKRRAGGLIQPAPHPAPQPGMSLIQNVPGVVYRCVMDARRTLVFVTQQVHAVTGHSPADLVGHGRGLTDLIHPSDRLSVAAALAVVRPGMPFEAEYRVIHTDGGVRWLHERGQLLEADGRRFMDGVLMDISDRRLAQEELAWQARHDPLTMLPNRRALDERLAAELAQRRRTGRPLSAVVLDLDHFKRINDDHGHEAGDRALAAVADRLGGCVGEAGFVARSGGEEFVMLLPGLRLPEAMRVAEAARAAVERDPVPGLPTVTISAGVAEATDGGEPLLAAADAALYRAKREGRNRVASAA